MSRLGVNDFHHTGPSVVEDSFLPAGDIGFVSFKRLERAACG